jgi:hypothetical protein
MYSSFSKGRRKNLFFIVKRKQVHKWVVAMQKLRAHWSADSFSSPKKIEGNQLAPRAISIQSTQKTSRT